MRLLKPNWVNHNGKPIFSLDIHPDGSRFATGGHSEDSCSGKVVIWNMAPVREEALENDSNIPKILCQMDNHLACVNCVRWSHSGRSLVSGGDDKLIMVWQAVKGAGSSTVFGTGGKVVNIEQWKCVSTLRGHSGDVLDLAWSPHDAWLASCSVDNTIVVWNSHKFPEQLAVLRGHSGLVKGITWDPVGKYIASQSDDKSLRVWRTLDWQQEAVVEKPFQECGGTTHVLRLDWSPDGSYIVSAHAMNNSGPTAQSIEREDWKISVDFVGHRKAITVVRFNNRIFSRKMDSEQRNEYTCCAIGSRDRSLSLWLTYLKRPLVVIHDLFNDSVMDISWNCKVAELLCCSWDGTVAFMDFDLEEIGLPLSQTEMCAFHEKVYGKSLSLDNGGGHSTDNVIVESADILALQQNVPDWNVEKPRTSDIDKGKVTPPKQKSYNRQIETITPDGRRRITPIMLSASPEVADVPLPFTSANSNIEFLTSTEPSKIIIEKIDCASGTSRLSSSPSKPTGSPTKPAGSPAHKPSPEVTPGTATAPVSATVPPPPSLPVKLAPVPTALAETKDNQREKKEDDEPIKSLSLKVKRKSDLASGATKRPKKDPKPPPAPPPTAPPSTSAVVATDAGHPPTKQDAPSHGIIMPPILPRKSFAKQILTSNGASVSLEVDNCVQAGSTTLHRLRCVTNGMTQWEQVFSAKMLVVTGSRMLVAVGCDDHSLTILTDRGKRIFPPIMLPSQHAVLECSSHHVLSLTQSAHLYLWNVHKKSCVIKHESLSPILRGGGNSLERTSVTDNGIVIVELSNGRSYSYHPDLSAWCLVNDPSDMLRQCIDQVTYPSTSPSGTLASLTSNKGSKTAARALLGANPTLQAVATMSHLETQVATCLALHSPHEYRFWLLTYVRYLSQQNKELRLREVFDELLVPPTNCDKSSHILGIDKDELLAELLPLLGTNLQLQRLYSEYRDRLDTRT